MHWQDVKPADEFVVPDTVGDAVFTIDCRSLPVDHAYALSQAIVHALPWFADEEDAGLHLVHGAGSGNGWTRPSAPAELLQLSRRTRLALRIPLHRAADAGALVGRTLDVDGHALRVERIAWRPLSCITTLFSRHVVVAAGDDEERFLGAAAAQLRALGIQPRKMMCGLTTRIATPGCALVTCSLMLAGLAREESVLLQQRGLGPGRKLGCGLFLPHKSIDDLRGGAQ